MSTSNVAYFVLEAIDFGVSTLELIFTKLLPTTALILGAFIQFLFQAIPSFFTGAQRHRLVGNSNNDYDVDEDYSYEQSEQTQHSNNRNVETYDLFSMNGLDIDPYEGIWERRSNQSHLHPHTPFDRSHRNVPQSSGIGGSKHMGTSNYRPRNIRSHSNALHGSRYNETNTSLLDGSRHTRGNSRDIHTSNAMLDDSPSRPQSNSYNSNHELDTTSTRTSRQSPSRHVHQQNHNIQSRRSLSSPKTLSWSTIQKTLHKYARNISLFFMAHSWH